MSIAERGVLGIEALSRADAHAVRQRGAGPLTVLLGHGIGGHQGQWDAVADVLAQHHRVVAFDLAGFGASDPRVYDVRAHASLLGYADDLAALVAELDLRGAVYVGHSMSGMAGLLAAAADPGIFSRIVTVGASARYLTDPKDHYLGAFDQETVDGMLAAMAGNYALWAGGFAPVAMHNPDRPELANEFAASLASARPEVALATFRAAFTSDFRAVMPRVTVPVLVVNAAEDPAVPASDAAWLAAALPGGRLAHLRGTGHFPHVADPEELLSTVAGFIAGD